MKAEQEVLQKLDVNTGKNKEPEMLNAQPVQERQEILRPDQKPYPLNFGQDMFRLQDNRTLSEVTSQRNQRLMMLKADENEKREERKLSFQQRAVARDQTLRDEISILNRNKRFIVGDTPEMDALKKKVIALSNYLNSKDALNGMRENGSINAQKFLQTTNTVFNEAIEACTWYLEHKTPSRWWGKGKARYEMVERIKKRAEAEHKAYTETHTALVQNAIVGASGQKQTPREILESIRVTRIIGKPVWQNQGNSTDVYRIVLEIDGKRRTFYMKENTQLISADIPGFLDRRSKQLTASLAHKKNGELDAVEKRMEENGTDETDYANGTNLLDAMKNKLEQEGNAAERHKMEQRFANFFGRDFDEMFKEYHAYKSALINGADEETYEKVLNVWKEKAKDPRNIMAREIVKQLTAAKDEEQVVEPMTAFEWMKQQICVGGDKGLDPQKDRDIIDLLEKMQEKSDAELKQNGAGRIETLFRITLGKEVELYGQMKQRGSIADNDIAAANNTATAELAKAAEFADVICDSFATAASYENRAGEYKQNFVTVIEVAEGEEMVELLHKAMDENVKIHYTPKAIEQLMELHAMDLITLQVDRHGRNFKCDWVKDKDGNYVVKTVKAYDNDMSFTEMSLAKVFMNEDGTSTKKAGFLPPLFKTVKKNSPEYLHLAKNYFGINAKRELRPTSKPQYYNDRDKKWKNMSEKNADTLMVMPFKFTEDFMKPGGTVKDRKTGEELPEQSKEAMAATQELIDLIRDLKEIIFRDKTMEDPDGYFMEHTIRSDLTEEERIQLGKRIRRLEVLHDKYDFTHNVKIGISGRMFLNALVGRMCPNMVGAKEGWITAMIYYLSNRYFRDQKVQEGYKSLAVEETEEMKALQKKDGQPGEEGDLYVPTLLHYSKKAYDNIQNLYNRLQQGDPVLIGKLNDMHISDEVTGTQTVSKLAALKTRVKETLDQLMQAKEAAEKFYKAMGYAENDPKAKFFLESKDFETFDDLSELSWNPGETYLAIDNDQYLAGQKEFADLMTPNEKQQWLDATNVRLTDQKRHKFHKVDTLENPLSGKLYKGNVA